MDYVYDGYDYSYQYPIHSKFEEYFTIINLDDVYELNLPKSSMKTFYEKCPLDIKKYNTDVKQFTSLIHMIEREKIKFMDFIVCIKSGVYINLRTKTVFKFLLNYDGIVDFLGEAVLCYNFSKTIGTKTYLTFYPEIMCVEYLYEEGLDIENIYKPKKEFLQYFYDNKEDYDDAIKDIHPYFFSMNLFDILINICNIAHNLSVLGLAFLDFKPNNFVFNNVTKKVVLIDAEMIYPFGYKKKCYKRKPCHSKELNEKIRNFPQTAPEYFTGNKVDEQSTVYGLMYTITTIISFIYNNIILEERNYNSITTSKHLLLLNIHDLLKSDIFRELLENAKKHNIMGNKNERPSILDIIIFLKAYIQRKNDAR